MAKREMIIPGFTGLDAEGQVDPFLRSLVGKFVDELREDEKVLYDYVGVAGLPDLWLATWDDETFTLEAMKSDGPGRGPSVSLGYNPANGPKTLLPALYVLVDTDIN